MGVGGGACGGYTRRLMAFSSRTKNIAAYIVCTLVWGTTWFSIRLSIAPGGYPTYEAAALRFTIAVVVMTLASPLTVLRLRERVGEQLPWLCVVGLINSVSYGVLYKGEETVPGSVAAVIYSALPLLTAFAAAVTRSEKISKGQIVGGAVALAGIVMVFRDRLHVSPEQAAGVGLVCVAVLANAGYLLVFRRKVRGEHSMAATGVFLAATAAGLWCFSAARGFAPIPWPLPLKPTAALVYLGIFGTVVTFVCYLYLIRNVGVVTSSTLIIVESLVALAVDRAWERQAKLTVPMFVGALVALAGSLVSILARPEDAAGEM